jgi:hypothetical protein
MAMNKYGRATKMTTPPEGMPAGLAAKYAALEGQLEKVVTMNRGLIDSGGLSAKGYNPNEMVDIDDKKTGKKTKVPYGSYEHQMAIYTPKDRFAKNYDGIGPNDIGVQKFRDNDLSNYNANPLNRHYSAGLKTDELRLRKGSDVFKKGASETITGDSFQEQFEQPIKGVTDLPSRYNKEQEILTSYGTMKGELSKMEEDFKKASQKLPTRPAKRDLPKLQGKISNLPEETTWENPEGGKYKTKKTILKSGTPSDGGAKLSIFTKGIKPGGGRAMPKIATATDVQYEPGAAKGRYNREEKMAKAFYAPESVVGKGGYSSKTDDVWKEEGSAMVQQDIPKMIKSDIKNIRAEKKQYIAGKTKGGKELDAISGEAVGEYNKAIKTAKLASRYAKRADISASGTDGKWIEGDDSKLKYFTPDYEKSTSKKVKGAMSGYVESANQERSRMNKLGNEEKAKIYPYSKSADDNATNRNSTSERMKKFWGY